MASLDGHTLFVDPESPENGLENLIVWVGSGSGQLLLNSAVS